MLTFETRGAELSDCGRYRYKLWRIWDPDLPPVLFVMLNPSTADANSDDRTIRRCVAFAKRDGFGGLLVGNLFAYRTPYPRVLRKAEEPVGEGNDGALAQMALQAGRTVVAWGPNGRYLSRDQQVLDILGDVWCLRMTQDGSPWHPLMLPETAALMEYERNRRLL